MISYISSARSGVAVRPSNSKRSVVAHNIRPQVGGPGLNKGNPLATVGIPDGIWPNPEFIARTLQDFPEKGVANVEEARALFSDGGYILLDVRSELAVSYGKVQNSVNCPMLIGKKRWDSENRKNAFDYKDVEDWLADVTKKIPNTETKILVMCSTGTKNTINALVKLEEAGYFNTVGLKGGFTAWERVFDYKLGRRVYGEYAEDYSGEGETSCGIHASGAGFAKVDPLEFGYDVVH